eukprot:g870.t1
MWFSAKKTILVEGATLDSKTKITVAATISLDDLSNALRQQFASLQPLDFIVEVWDPDFDEWTMLADVSALGAKAKIRVTERKSNPASQRGFKYLSPERGTLHRNEFKRLEDRLNKGGMGAEETSSAGVDAIKHIEGVLREVCLCNGLDDGSGGVVVKSTKNSRVIQKKLHGMGAYLLQMKPMKAPLSKQLGSQLWKAKDVRNTVSHDTFLLPVGKGLEYCMLGLELLKQVGSPVSRFEAKVLDRCAQYSPDEIVEQRLLGSGSCGEVKLVTVCGQAMAAKMLIVDDKKKLLKEVRAMIELPHLNIVRLLGVCVHPSKTRILMEYMEKGSLRQVLDAQPSHSLPVSQLFDILSQIACGMAFAHMHQPRPIIHRDLKPSNILIDRYMRAAVADLGIASGVSTITATKQAGGTLAYSAPEVLDNDKWTTAGDVFSFGVTMWEALTGKVPWEEASGRGFITNSVVNKQVRPHSKPWDTPVLLTLDGDEQQQYQQFFTQLIKDCWAQEADERLAFAEVTGRFEAFAACRMAINTALDQELLDTQADFKDATASTPAPTKVDPVWTKPKKRRKGKTNEKAKQQDLDLDVGIAQAKAEFRSLLWGEFLRLSPWTIPAILIAAFLRWEYVRNAWCPDEMQNLVSVLLVFVVVVVSLHRDNRRRPGD